MGANKKDKPKKKSAAQEGWDRYYENEKQRLTGEHLTGERNPLIVALAEYGEDRKKKAREDRQTRDFRGGNSKGPSVLDRMAPADQSAVRSVHSALNWDFSDAKKEADSSAETRRFLRADRARRAASKKSK